MGNVLGDLLRCARQASLHVFAGRVLPGTEQFENDQKRTNRDRCIRQVECRPYKRTSAQFQKIGYATMKHTIEHIPRRASGYQSQASLTQEIAGASF